MSLILFYRHSHLRRHYTLASVSYSLYAFPKTLRGVFVVTHECTRRPRALWTVTTDSSTCLRRLNISLDVSIYIRSYLQGSNTYHGRASSQNNGGAPLDP